MTPANPEITVLPNGQWTITEDTHLSKWAREHGHIVTDPYLFRFLKPHLAHAEVVWDVGANIGDHARQYLDWGLEVVAVEPNPIAFVCLENNCPEARLINAAASDSEDGELRFETLENVGASRISPEGDLTVRSVMLDNEHLPAPDFIKIDVEGWELSALRGMVETIEECRPTVFCEINRGALEANGVDPQDILDWFGDRGYALGSLYPEGATWGDPQFDALFVPTTR